MKIIVDLTYVGHDTQKVEGCYIYYLYVVIHGCKVHYKNIKIFFLMCLIIHENKMERLLVELCCFLSLGNSFTNIR
jgi:hypothetical protein